MKPSSVRKRTLLFVCLFAILFLPCSSLIVAEAPNASVSVSIAYHNLAFEDRVFLLYAVKVTGADESIQPFMEFTKEDEKAVTVTPYDYNFLPNGDDNQYHLFAFTDLDAREMTDIVTAIAGVTVDNKTYYSASDTYSICEYAACQLGVMPGRPGTENETLKDLLVAMLDYGTKAQIHFNYRTDRLANRHYLSFADVGRTPTEGIKYRDNGDGTATVTGYEGDEKNIVIASKTDEGLTVTAIADEAFLNNTSIETVDIPNTVKVIGQKAFYGCASLKKVMIPATLETFGEHIFSYSEMLEIHFGGTKAQWETLTAKNPEWYNDDKLTIILSDGSLYE